MTSATTPKTIELYGHGVQHEAVAAGAITPGMLVARAAGGKVQAHAAEAGIAQPAFAIEYGFTGGGIDDAYAADDQVVFKVYTPGSGVYALLAAGEDAAENAYLVSNGDGTLKVLAAAEGGTVIAQAIEAVDNTGGAGAVRIRVDVVAAAYVAPQA